MTEQKPKPPILRSKRGVLILLAAIVAIFAVLYVSIGATAFLRTQETEGTDVVPRGDAES